MTASGIIPGTPPTVEVVGRAEILLVDDRAENLLALEAILEPLGVDLTRAMSGEEALRHLLRHDPAVILLDVQMPGMNGFETAEVIKSRERSKHIPIIFLTAISKEDAYVFKGYEVGAVDYLFKPFQPGILRSKVAALVDLHLRQRRMAAQEQKLREAERQTLELRHMRELLQSEARFRDIVGSAMDAIVTFDETGTITMFNAAAEEMFGCPASEAVGSNVSRFVGRTGPDDRLPLDVLRELGDEWRVHRGRDGRRGASATPFTGCRANEETFPVEATVSCLDAAGKSYTIIARDISLRQQHEQALRHQSESLARSAQELQQLNEELQRRQDALERAMSARSRFYASMSHELRTPINAVLGYSTLLLERIYGPLNEKQAQGIDRTQKAARHLLELVNDVLDLSKIEAGKIDLRLQPVMFPALLDDLFVTVRPLADAHQSTLSLEHVGDHFEILSDPRRVRQIVLNLLSNAIKFGDGKPIEVTCRRRDDGGVVVEVTDHGPGIAPDDLDRIFQEFVQLGRTQLQDGTGLGLPISRRLAELLNGTLDVRSTVGEGSTFTLSLPPEMAQQPLFDTAGEQAAGRRTSGEEALEAVRAARSAKGASSELPARDEKAVREASPPGARQTKRLPKRG